MAKTITEKAVEKIRKEMEKNADDYVQIIGQFLLSVVAQDEKAATAVIEKGKNIEGAMDVMEKEAKKKKAKGHRSALTSREGFGIVAKYYGFEYKAADIFGTPQTKETVKEEQDILNISLKDMLQ